MNQTKWWKCDFQVATPAWKFHSTAGIDLAGKEGREAFLDEYMRALKSRGIEVIALADHNTGEWIDIVKEAGLRHGVHVFPGCEVTTGTGADGVHLLIIGSREKTAQDFDRLIHGVLGFGAENPAFLNRGGQQVPASSPKTLLQILNDLPEGFLAIAPHVLTDNGIASTAKGDIRWKALHHERLVAIDPGNCAAGNILGDSFNARFRRRELSDFPRLPELAFVSTSDAYSIDDLGSRFTWIRMGEVSLEGLRQAFIDHESRVLCDWSPHLASFPGRDPNNIRHAWISQVSLAGQLGNSNLPLELPFHPNLNVLIGGRGSGKSTVVAAIRALYSSTSGLPRRLEDEANSFIRTVFANAQLSARHHVQESQEEQSANWTLSAGSLTSTGGATAVTNFPVTVVSQKELFERAAGDKSDPSLPSRSLLALLDSSIGYVAEDIKTIGSFGRRLDDSRSAWGVAVRDLVQLEQDIAQLPALRQQQSTLRGQADAFSSPEVKARLARIGARETEQKVLKFMTERLEEVILNVRESVAMLGGPINGAMPADPELASSYAENLALISSVISNFDRAIKSATDVATTSLAEVSQKILQSAWQRDYDAAMQDLQGYKSELSAKGLSTTEFTRIQEELERVTERVASLEAKLFDISGARDASERAWESVQVLYTERRQARQQMLDEIAHRSERLRFKVQSAYDTGPWVEALRASANFRADAYLDDVPQLAAWLWRSSEEQRAHRVRMWRDSLASGDMRAIQSAADLRQVFAERLSKLDSVLRLRLASYAPDDVVQMEFLKDGSDPALNANWQPITEGSPGQRTAAMLAFVLHHGREPLVLDQPEDDLDSEWISNLVVKELRKSRWSRQLIVISHNANIPVLGDAEQVVALENREGSLRIRRTPTASSPVLHVGPVEKREVRQDIQTIMEGGVAAFMRREQKYNNETKQYKADRGA